VDKRKKIKRVPVHIGLQQDPAKLHLNTKAVFGYR
jgi:hypothetical protein